MRPASATASLLACGVLAACGATGGPRAATTALRVSPPVAGRCDAVARAELVRIARRVYEQGVTGRNETAAARRLRTSVALTAAVAAHDPVGTQAALAPLLKHQIVRIRITDGTRVLADVGTSPAYAPVAGDLVLGGRVVGHYVMSVARDADFIGLVRRLTGGSVAVGRDPAAGATATLPATAYPAGPATVSLTLPPVPPAACGPTVADTQLATIGLVAQRLLAAEQGATPVVRHAEKDPAFRRAVLAADPAGVRAAIVTFFRDKRFHIVRVRAWNAGGLINDVGGPYVLSPATGTIRGPGGAVGGRFQLAVQDDTGFIKLIHRFTGAQVVLRMGTRTVPGSTLDPGPPFQAGLSSVTYGHRTYRAYGLVGTAFPTGPLDVSLLVS